MGLYNKFKINEKKALHDSSVGVGIVFAEKRHFSKNLKKP